MLNRLLPLVVFLRKRWPSLYQLVVRIASRAFANRLGLYPRVLGNEVRAVTAVLQGSQWNMAYGKGLEHERLEAEFAAYTGCAHAVAVTSGGVALQMSLRALGLGHGTEAIHQIDTCSATAMACMNAGVTPIFSDISGQTFMLDISKVRAAAGPDTRAIIGTHMWGNPEDMRALRSVADEKGYRLIEDACLGLGARVQGRMAGGWGDVGVYSFGCIKPIQAGEGGMIVTQDAALARELRAMRHWGDRGLDFGERDATQLSWNGRMSEILAAVIREQLKGYPDHLVRVRAGVARFAAALSQTPGFELVLGTSDSIEDCVFTQLSLRLDESLTGLSKAALWNHLVKSGVRVWNANFEPINSLSLFRKGTWRQWIVRGDIDRVARNYDATYPVCRQVFDTTGLGLSKMNFLSEQNIDHLVATLKAAIRK